MPRGVLGLTLRCSRKYLRYIANRRCQQIGVDTIVSRREQSVSLDERDDRSQESGISSNPVIDTKPEVRSVGTRPLPPVRVRFRHLYQDLRSSRAGKEFNSPGLTPAVE